MDSPILIDKNYIEELDEDDYSELKSTTIEMIDDYITEHAIKMSSPSFTEDLLLDITHIIYQDLYQSDLCNLNDFDSIMDFAEECFDIVCMFRKIPERSEISVDEVIETVTALTLQKIGEKPQPVQKSSEWYEYRKQHITASNIWKLIASETQYNSFIYDKCANSSANGSYTNNPASPLAWGNKYEAVTTMLYELIYDTKVGVYGLIEHDNYAFLAASPDGINCGVEGGARYGRMVEIKNIVNREITGIPSEPYWAQMQIQMEVCGLDECDFVETRIKEFADEDDFYRIKEDENDGATNRWCGVIASFVEKKSVNMWEYPTLYKYMAPSLNASARETVSDWVESVKCEMADTHIFYGVKYWYLDEFSCVLVRRNKLWFNAILPIISEAWNTILKERDGGYEHRAPKKRAILPDMVVKIDGNNHVFQNIPNSKSICLIKLEEEKTP